MSKKVPSIAEAQALLKEAVEANKDQLITGLRTLRSQLEDLVAVLGPKGIPKEIDRELEALTQIRNEVSHGRSSAYVKVDEKIEWMTELLSQNGGEMPKVDLLDAAKREWTGRKISQQFLDRAVDEAFDTRKESDATVTVLLKGGTTD